MKPTFKFTLGFALMVIFILAAMTLEDVNFAIFISFPAALIICGGIFGFWVLSFPLGAIKTSFNSLLADKISEEDARLSSLFFSKSANISLCMGFVGGILGLAKALGSSAPAVAEGLGDACVAVLYGYFGYIIFTALGTSILSTNAELKLTSKREEESIIGITSACFALILGSIFMALWLMFIYRGVH